MKAATFAGLAIVLFTPKMDMGSFATPPNDLLLLQAGP